MTFITYTLNILLQGKWTRNIENSSCITQVFDQSDALYNKNVPPLIPTDYQVASHVPDVQYCSKVWGQ